MICTQPVWPSTALANAFSSSSSPGAIFPFPGPAPALHQREMYLRALEQEREEILAAAYASKRSNSPLAEECPCLQTHTNNFDDEDDIESDREEDDDGHAVSKFDDRGRELHFRETVRQRQARLEFLRRQEFARRIAHRGLEDAKASAYAIVRCFLSSLPLIHLLT